MMPKPESATVMIVEDDKAVSEMIAFTLSRAGMRTMQACDADGALNCLESHSPDIVILDWKLENEKAKDDLDGIDVLKYIRRHHRTRDLPVMMLTGKTDELARLAAFRSGADDFVCKPFFREELLLRVEAILRRSQPNGEVTKYRFGDLRLDAVSYRIAYASNDVNLCGVEFKLLRFFMGNPDRVFSRAQLLDKVWQRSGYVEERTVDVHIMRIRAALKKADCPSCIQTVRGLGYRFSPAELQSAAPANSQANGRSNDGQVSSYSQSG